MANAPNPITSPPSVPGQPYSATAPGSSDSQSTSEHVYDAAGGPGAGEPWVKVQDGGAAGPNGTVSGSWSGDGASSGGAWKQT